MTECAQCSRRSLRVLGRPGDQDTHSIGQPFQRTGLQLQASFATKCGSLCLRVGTKRLLQRYVGKTAATRSDDLAAKTERAVREAGEAADWSRARAIQGRLKCALAGERNG